MTTHCRKVFNQKKKSCGLCLLWLMYLDKCHFLSLILVFQIIIFHPLYPPFFSSFYTVLPPLFNLWTKILYLFLILLYPLQTSSKPLFYFFSYFCYSTRATNSGSCILFLNFFFSFSSAMAVTQFKNPTCSKTQLYSSQLSFLSKTLPRRHHCTFAPLHRTQHARISCSVAPKWATLFFFIQLYVY